MQKTLHPQPTTTAANPGRIRWGICGLLFALVAISYIDRLIIGILKKPIGAQLGWSEQDYGYIAAAFCILRVLVKYGSEPVACNRSWRGTARNKAPIPST